MAVIQPQEGGLREFAYSLIFLKVMSRREVFRDRSICLLRAADKIIKLALIKSESVQEIKRCSKDDPRCRIKLQMAGMSSVEASPLISSVCTLGVGRQRQNQSNRLSTSGSGINLISLKGGATAFEE